MAHETSPKSSVSEFLGGLISFPDFMIFIPVKDRFDPCPLCNAFSHIYQELIIPIKPINKIPKFKAFLYGLSTAWNSAPPLVFIT